jgi:hypothetical protein
LFGQLLGEGKYGSKREKNEKSQGQVTLYIGLPVMMVFTYELE